MGKKKIKDATKQIEWLESMQELNNATKVEKLKLITMKISPSLLEAFKLKCELEKRPYTTKIKELMEEYLRKQ
jgi:predicted DNA binding CopG/RHH family protein